MLSRLLGLVREQVFAITLGAGVYSDAFLAAFRIPNLLRDLFAEGALSTAFVPTYVATLRRESREAAFALANRVMSTLTIYLGLIALVAHRVPGAGGAAGRDGVLAREGGAVRDAGPDHDAVPADDLARGRRDGRAERGEKFTAPALASSMFNLVAIVGRRRRLAVGSVAAGGRDHLGGADAGWRRSRSWRSRCRRSGGSAFARACAPISGCATRGRGGSRR